VSAQPSVLQVVILRDGLLVGTEVLTPGSYSVGSDPSSDLRLDDASVDPRHAMLYFQNGRSAIQDAGSELGVYVNGHRVTACEIRSADEVLCGPFVLKTRILSQRPAEQEGPPPEVAALLGAAPPRPAAPQAAARPFRPPAQSVGRRVTPDAMEAVPTYPAQMDNTVPTAYPPAGMPRSAAQAAVVPIGPPPTPVATPHRAPASSRGGPAMVQASPQPVPVPMPPPAAMPASTVPSTRRRATQEMQPVGPPPSMVLADDFLADAMPEQEALEAPPPQQSAPVRAPIPSQGRAPVPSQGRAPIPSQGRAPIPSQGRAPVPSQGRAPVPSQGRAPVPSQGRAPAAPPVQAPQAVAAGGEPARPTHAPRMAPGKGAAQLYLELYWGAVRREARRFQPGKQPVLASTHERAPMPMWGFELPEGNFTLAEPLNGSYRLFVPPGASVERAGKDGRFQPVPPSSLEADGNRRFVTLSDGAAARLNQGQMSLLAYAAPVPEKVFVNPLRGLPWLALVWFALFTSVMGAFIVLRPRSPESPDFTAKNLPPIALRLIAPDPKKKEEAKKKLESIKEKARPAKTAEKPTAKPVEKPVEKVVQRTPPRPVAPPPPESRALKALAKLSAAGPATNDLLAAVDKLGSGPGNKNVKTSNYKLSGLISKAPIANAGLGTFGLGGGGKGGGATLGAELLRGKGGGGIGALGAGNVGKGKVGGTVTRATSRSISAPQGSIDREAVARVINSHLQEVHACYERALLKDPGLAGKVVLEWTIGGAGKVTAAKTKSSTLNNASVESCILNSLKGWAFPAPKGGVVIISYPFIFNSVGY
jgi:outer membrane biosynthesis protein TonB